MILAGSKVPGRCSQVLAVLTPWFLFIELEDAGNNKALLPAPGIIDLCSSSCDLEDVHSACLLQDKARQSAPQPAERCTLPVTWRCQSWAEITSVAKLSPPAIRQCPEKPAVPPHSQSRQHRKSRMPQRVHREPCKKDTVSKQLCGHQQADSAGMLVDHSLPLAVTPYA